MRKLTVVTLLATVTISAMTVGCLEEENNPTAVEWVSYNQAIEKSNTTGKPVMVDFYADWCGPCQQMDATTYQNQQIIQKIADSFIAAKVNVDQQQVLASQYGIRSIPTIVYLNETGSQIHRTVGYRSASQLMNDMEQILQAT